MQHQGDVLDFKYLGKDLLASCTNNNRINIWDTIHAERVKTYQVYVEKLFVLPDRKLIAGLVDNETIMLMSLDTFELNEIDTYVMHTYFEPLENNRIASVEINDLEEIIEHNITFWLIKGLELEKIGQIKGAHRVQINCLKALPDRFLASGDQCGLIRIWDDSMSLVSELKGHSFWISSLQLMPNGLLMSCAWDKSVRIWNYEHGECLHVLRENDSVHAALMLPDGIFVCLVHDYLKFYESNTFSCVSYVPKEALGAQIKLDSIECMPNSAFAVSSCKQIILFDFKKET